VRRRLAILALLPLVGLLSTASRCYERRDHDPTPGLIDETLSLSVSGGQTSIPADGISRLHLVAQLTPRADLDKRTVTFSASAGTLLGGAPGTNGEREVAADSTGQATIDLQSAQQVGPATVQARVKEVPGVVRTLAVSFTAANPNDTIRFVASPSAAPADGATQSAFTVQISPSLAVGTPVTFLTSAGLWSPESAATATRNADGSFQATAVLTSPAAIGSGRVRATANGVTREVGIDFRRALPDRILVSTNGKVTVQANLTDSVTVSATFLRDVGTVTAGTAATFAATDRDGRPIGLFHDATVTDATGKATATFVAGTTTYRGPVTLAVGSQDTSVRGTATIEIVSP